MNDLELAAIEVLNRVYSTSKDGGIARAFTEQIMGVTQSGWKIGLDENGWFYSKGDRRKPFPEGQSAVLAQNLEGLIGVPELWEGATTPNSLSLIATEDFTRKAIRRYLSEKRFVMFNAMPVRNLGSSRATYDGLQNPELIGKMKRQRDQVVYPVRRL